MQPVPEVSLADVERVINRDFPIEQRLRVRQLFDESPRQSPRVKLAVMKLAAGDLTKLQEWLEIGRSDFRDVLAAAEYPSCRYDTFELPPAEQQKIFDTDWKQYNEWLRKLP